MTKHAKRTLTTGNLVLMGLFVVLGIYSGKLIVSAFTPDPPAVVVYEDGSGVLPAGSFNPVLGDVSGRHFCMDTELCEKALDGVDNTQYGEIGSAVGR